MRVFLTGGTGFIGSRVARLLRERDHEVVALVRSLARATALDGIGCELIEGDLNDRIDIDRGVVGADAVVHLAARLEVGLPKHECPQMEDVNVGGVRRVLDSAIEAGVPRILYASTVNVFGDTKGAIVDETFSRDESNGFLSCYDASKYKAHRLAQSRIDDGAPIVIVQPSVVYGPGDHFTIGKEILRAAQGRLFAMMLAETGISMAYVDDVADGIARVFDNGRVGESYILSGDNVRLGDVLRRAAEIAGRRLPRRHIPTSILKLVSPFGPFIAPRLGYPPNLHELIEAGGGRTYWVSDRKARDELGYTSRSLDDGLRSTLAAAGIAAR